MTTTELHVRVGTELRCMCDLQFCCVRGLVTLARKRERAWRVARERERERLLW